MGSAACNMNRKQRRAQGAQSTNITSSDQIPLARPKDDAPRKAKTLYEIAAEKQAALMPNERAFETSPDSTNVVKVQIGPDGKVSPLKDTKSEEEVNPWLDTLLLASSLSALHFTLETLTIHQYAEELRFKPIFMHTIFLAFPTLAFLIHLLHGNFLTLTLSDRTREVLQAGQVLMFLTMANLAGCYLIHLTNDKGYMAVMKNAPSVGTVWVWAVLELGLVGAIAGVVGPGAYAWYHGYGIF